MNIKDIYLDSLKELGYTEIEARFIYIVATHSGYFTVRQFLDFAEAKRGKRSDKLAEKLVRNKHASAEMFRKNARVYHIFARKIYAPIGKENIRNRRDHEFQFVKTRLVALDFILANQRYDYFETEADKVRYFCGALGIEQHALPTKLYLGTKNPSVTPRYFVDKFPMFLPMITGSPAVTFTYIAPEAENLVAFVTHLQNYLPLFRSLKQFRFLFVSPCEPLFPKARAIFSSVVKGPLELPSVAEISRYFHVRKLWESRQFAALRNEDIEFLNEATRRFAAVHIQEIYKEWKTGSLTEAHLVSLFPAPDSNRKITFDTFAVASHRHLYSGMAA
ncbi:MAG: hypothetical protein ACYDCD_10880 [Candidatus Acidiferrales bacterium]